MIIVIIIIVQIIIIIIIVRAGSRVPRGAGRADGQESTDTASLRTRILDFRGFDSSRTLILRGGMLMSMGNFPGSLSQGILVQ